MSDYTQGPWASIPQGNGSTMIVHEFITGDQINPKGFRLIANVFARMSTLKEDEANSRLIAAAPNLLEALQAALACGMIPSTSASEGGAAKYSEQVQIADRARAAVANATGAAS